MDTNGINVDEYNDWLDNRQREVERQLEDESEGWIRIAEELERKEKTV